MGLRRRRRAATERATHRPRRTRVWEAAVAGVVSGLLFALVVAAVGSVLPLGTEFRSVAWVVHLGYGTMFGALVWGVHIAFVWPLWAVSVSVPSPPMVPFLNGASLLSYVFFGVILGTVIDLVN